MVPVLIGVVIVCVILSAFFSSCEIAYSSVSRIRLKKEAEEGNKKAEAALKIIDNYSQTLSTILIGNNLVNILISSVGTIILTRLMTNYDEDIISITSILLFTIILLIFGEILPKAFANKNSHFLALFYTRIYNFFRIVFFPITWLVNKMLGRILRKFKHKDDEPTATDEELITITEELEEEGIIDEDDAELIKSAIDFIDVVAQEIMIPRVDVYAIDIDDPLRESIQDEEIYRYSRVPVYEDTIDNIIGILQTSDMMKLILNNQEVDIRSLLREPLYVHKTKPISAILTEMKNEHNHIAIVVDEFGGVMGILTMEDIIEELIGDVFDELDEVVLDYHQISETEYQVDGDMNIYDFLELIEYDDRDFESEYTTVGGWCTDMLQKFPETGDTFDFANITVTILDVDKMRVGNIKVDIHPVEDEEE